jgi:preprotein translocase subunit SecE
MRRVIFIALVVLVVVIVALAILSGFAAGLITGVSK